MGGAMRVGNWNNSVRGGTRKVLMRRQILPICLAAMMSVKRRSAEDGVVVRARSKYE
jgi:hypothetical protein